MRKSLACIKICLMMFLLPLVSNAQAQEFQVRVIVDQLNVRPAPPKFTLSTVFTFNYQVSPATHQVKNKSILNVHEVKSIGNEAEWLNVSFTTADGVNVYGWVYAGRHNAWVNVELINDQNGSIHNIKNENIFISILNLVVPKAHASTAIPLNEEEGTKADAPYVFLVLIFNVALFLGAMFFGKKIHNDSVFLIFTGVSTLLIEGVVTETGFWGFLKTFF